MHGPKPRSHAIKLNKKVRRLGLKITLSARAAEGKASLCVCVCVRARDKEVERRKSVGRSMGYDSSPEPFCFVDVFLFSSFFIVFFSSFFFLPRWALIEGFVAISRVRVEIMPIIMLVSGRLPCERFMGN